MDVDDWLITERVLLFLVYCVPLGFVFSNSSFVIVWMHSNQQRYRVVCAFFFSVRFNCERCLGFRVLMLFSSHYTLLNMNSI